VYCFFDSRGRMATADYRLLQRLCSVCECTARTCNSSAKSPTFTEFTTMTIIASRITWMLGDLLTRTIWFLINDRQLVCVENCNTLLQNSFLLECYRTIHSIRCMFFLPPPRKLSYTRRVTNVEVRATTGCHPLSHLVTDRRLRLFGHIARSSPQEDHNRAVAAVIRGVPPDWKRPLGRPSHTWLRAVDADLGQQMNFRSASTSNCFRSHHTTMIFKHSTIPFLDRL